MSAPVPPLTLVDAASPGPPRAGDADAPNADVPNVGARPARAPVAAQVEALFRAHYRAFVQFAAHHLRTRDAAEEAVQEAFLRVWERAEREHLAEVTQSYVFTAVHHQVLARRRRARVEQRWTARAAAGVQAGADEPAGTDASAAALEAALEVDDLARAVRRAVAELSDKTREVFLLSRERGLPYAEIARMQGVSVKTVEMHMTRALKALRAAVRGASVGLFVAAAALVGGLAAWIGDV